MHPALGQGPSLCFCGHTRLLSGPPGHGCLSATDSLSIPPTWVSGLQRRSVVPPVWARPLGMGGGGGEQGGTLLADPFPGLTAPPAVSPGHLCGSSGLGRLCRLVICRQRQPHRLPGFHQPGLPGNFRTARGQPEASADRGGVYSWTRAWGAVLAAPPPCRPHPLVCLQRVSRRLLSSDPQPPHGAVRERQG